MNSNNKDNCHPLSSHCVPQAGLAALCTLSFFFFFFFFLVFLGPHPQHMAVLRPGV